LSTRELAAIRQPTLLAYGTEDPVGSLDLWSNMVETLPQGELLVVQGGGHMPWLDDPRIVANRLEDFLSS
ncbi:MAG TPA: alpha/beta hydrolase, partial [Gaiella sp.]|nr:alpha/beta hydrolase [Gaiella sp.]